jgi:hypothetical protein
MRVGKFLVSLCRAVYVAIHATYTDIIYLRGFSAVADGMEAPLLPTLGYLH